MTRSRPVIVRKARNEIKTGESERQRDTERERDNCIFFAYTRLWQPLPFSFVFSLSLSILLRFSPSLSLSVSSLSEHFLSKKDVSLFIILDAERRTVAGLDNWTANPSEDSPGAPAANKIVFHPLAGENFVPLSVLLLAPSRCLSFRGASSYIKARLRLSSSSNVAAVAAAAALPASHPSPPRGLPSVPFSPSRAATSPNSCPSLPPFPLLWPPTLNPILCTTHKLLYRGFSSCEPTSGSSPRDRHVPVGVAWHRSPDRPTSRSLCPRARARVAQPARGPLPWLHESRVDCKHICLFISRRKYRPLYARYYFAKLFARETASIFLLSSCYAPVCMFFAAFYFFVHPFIRG